MTKIYYFFIMLILISTSYISDIFQNYSNRELPKILLGIFLILFFIENYKWDKLNLKKDLILFAPIIFLKRFYLSCFLIFISKYIKKTIRLKQVFLILTFIYLGILLINSLGILDFNNIKYGVRNFENFAIYRHSLGFRHPNTAMSLLLPVFFLLYYIYYKEFPKLVIGIILLVGTIIFGLTFSRTTFLLVLLLVILILVKDKYIKKLKFLFLTEGIIISIFSVCLPIFFKRGILNEMLSWRLWYFYYYLKSFKLTYFGIENLKVIYEEIPLDNIYLRIIYENGMISFIVFLILIFYIMKLLFEYDDMKAVRIFSVLLILGFMEHMAFHYYMNVIIFILPEYIYNLELENKNK